MHAWRAKDHPSMDLYSLSLLLVLSVFVLAIALLFRQRHQPPPKAATAVVKPYPIIGNLPRFIKNGNRLLDWATELVSSSPTGTVTVAPYVFTADPANVEHTARSRFASYRKGHAITSALHDFLGHGIFNANGDLWRRQRKTASFEFNTRSLRAFLFDSVRRELDRRFVPLLAEASRNGEVLDLQDALERFAFDNICSLLLGEDPGVLGRTGNDEWESFYHAFEEATDLSIDRTKYPFNWMWKLVRWLNAGAEPRLNVSLATVRNTIDHLVQSNDHHGSLLSRFTKSGSYSSLFLRDMVVSFVIAGRDTTPSALTWFFWLLSSHLDVADRILAELRSVRQSNSENQRDAWTLDELRGMQYLHAALSESMRLFPPVPLLPRECVEDDVLPDGTPVRKGWTLMYSAYAMGRAEKVWGKDCGEFRPERWLDEGGAFRPENPFRYPVFHAGPRLCLGKDMAYVQMKAVAATVLERFEMAVEEERGEHQLSMTMRMVGGLPVRVKERKA